MENNNYYDEEYYFYINDKEYSFSKILLSIGIEDEIKKYEKKIDDKTYLNIKDMDYKMLKTFYDRVTDTIGMNLMETETKKEDNYAVKFGPKLREIDYFSNLLHKKGNDEKACELILKTTEGALDYYNAVISENEGIIR